jgi:hypothetical protein
MKGMSSYVYSSEHKSPSNVVTYLLDDKTRC